MNFKNPVSNKKDKKNIMKIHKVFDKIFYANQIAQNMKSKHRVFIFVATSKPPIIYI